MITKSNAQYAEELKKIRKSYKLKQSVMVELLNLESQQQYSDLENNKKHFSEELILKICSVFNISITQFIKNPAPDAVVKQFLNKEDLLTIENDQDNEIKLLLYKKLFFESKMENITIKLNSLHTDYNALDIRPCKHKIHVII